MYCDTIYRTEVGGSKHFCMVTPSIGQKLEAANPSVLWHHLQARSWGQQTLLYCDTIYRTDVGDSKHFCIVTPSTGQKLVTANPSVL